MPGLWDRSFLLRREICGLRFAFRRAQEVTKKVTCQEGAFRFSSFIRSAPRQLPVLLPAREMRNPQLIRAAGVSELASPRGFEPGFSDRIHFQHNRTYVPESV